MQATESNIEDVNHIISMNTTYQSENKLYYNKKDILIYNEDCITGIDKLIKSKKQIHLTITSPPYFNVKDYVEYENYKKYLLFLESLFTKIYTITRPGRICCVNISNILIIRKNRNSESKRIPLAFHFVLLMEKIKWEFLEDIIWVKPEGAAKNRNGGFYQHRQPVAYKPNVVNEYIFVFKKPSPHLIDKVVRSYNALDSLNSKVEDGYERSNVWKINPETRGKHPAPYPIALTDKLIQYYSFTGDTILDPFMGSGTTALSAIKYNRKCIGFEIHSKYIDMFKERASEVQPMSLISRIDLNKEEYVELSKEEALEKILKHNKKFLHAVCKNNSIDFKGELKKELANGIYTKLFTI